MRLSLVLAALAFATGAAAQTPAAPEQPLLYQLAGDVRPKRMRADIEAMVGFGTRHTLSDQVGSPGTELEFAL